MLEESAIRAKLLELGVRYDEELPDYILVMIVNKKSRQQMHEDLHLFLENNTAPFVDWLHEQVLKKLQKVTVAKKKTTREFVPSVLIKQEEGLKKRKTATSFLEDQTATEVAKKLLGKTLKEDKQVEKETTSKLESSNECTDPSHKEKEKKSTRETELDDHSTKTSLTSYESKNDSVKKVIVSLEQSSSKSNQSVFKSNPSQSESGCSKPAYETIKNSDLDKSVQVHGKRSRNSGQEDDVSVSDSKRLKSSVIKPKITSVVSIKNRLGIISSRKKFDVHQERRVFANKPRHGEEHQFEYNRRNNFSRSRNLESNDNSRKGCDFEIKIRGSEKSFDIRNRLGRARDDRSNVNVEAREKIHITGKPVAPIKNRLGASNCSRSQKQSTAKMQEIEEDRRIDCKEERSNFRGRNVKYRLGPIRKDFRANVGRGAFKSSSKNVVTEKDRDSINLRIENDLDEDDLSFISVAPIKSHIIAVQKSLPEKANREKVKSDDKQLSDTEDEEFEDYKISSKVIVTPRPLKPLQPTQKRATQSLLLRAVAEANQSVVTKKNPEPSLMEAKPSPKRSKPIESWAVGKNLSVHLDSQKRFVMEKIQIELTTVKTSDTKSYDSREVTDEHIGVVRSLFQQSNNDQKFLVTLNGYNNNVLKEKISSDKEEGLEMEVNEYAEQELSTNQSIPLQQNESDSIEGQQNESNSIACQQNESDSITMHIPNTEEDDEDSNNSKESNNDENQNTENIDIVEEGPRQTRKPSPIIYNRSRSRTPELNLTKVSVSSATSHAAEKFAIDSVSVSIRAESDKKCRYWPNCTSGKKCAYYHPGVPCSAFPACKFGENCTYLHPKCKFGLACTKVGCVFSHPSEKCTYHPYCTKPSCSYAHSSTKTALPTHGPNRKAKFTWRRRN